MLFIAGIPATEQPELPLIDKRPRDISWGEGGSRVDAEPAVRCRSGRNDPECSTDESGGRIAGVNPNASLLGPQVGHLGDPLTEIHDFARGPPDLAVISRPSGKLLAHLYPDPSA